MARESPAGVGAIVVLSGARHFDEGGTSITAAGAWPIKDRVFFNEGGIVNICVCASVAHVIGGNIIDYVVKLCKFGLLTLNQSERERLNKLLTSRRSSSIFPCLKASGIRSPIREKMSLNKAIG